jgi:hypothetical protein
MPEATRVVEYGGVPVLYVLNADNRTYSMSVNGSSGAAVNSAGSLTKPIANSFASLTIPVGAVKSLADFPGGIPATANGAVLTLEGDLIGSDEIRFREDAGNPAVGVGRVLRAGPSGESELRIPSRDILLGLRLLLVGDGGTAGAILGVTFYE